MNALELRAVNKKYPGFTLALEHLELPGGCIMGLIGENGVGKSTTIKLILDMIRADSGQITLLGEDIHKRKKLSREEIGVVLDGVGISGELNAQEAGRIMKRIFQHWDRKVYDSLLDRFSLPRDKKFKDFSQGMKMKLNIVTALSHHAKLLILDEPTNGLDPVARDDVMELLEEFTRKEEHSVFISSHIVSDLEKICDYIAFLHQGRMLLCEEKDRLYEEYGVIHCSSEQFHKLEPSAVCGSRSSSYGVEAVVRRNAVPAEVPLSPVDIEQLFIFMVKEAV